MAGEVTMKDLQSLQGYCNKSIADVRRKVDTNYQVNENSLNAVEASFKRYAAQIAAIEKVVNAQAAVIGKHAEAINAQAALINQLQKG